MAHDDTPQLVSDKLTIREVERFPNVSGDYQLYGRLTDTVAAMTAGGPQAEEIYAETVRAQRDDDAFVETVVRTLDALDESAYLERWALAQLLIDLEQPSTADYLAAFVRRPIPEERSDDPAHGLSTVTEEVILRTTAIEGLARLLRREVDTSETLLETIASSDYVAMRRAAWFALQESGRDDVVERARGLLEETGDGWIAELRRIPVQDAEQHDPHLIDPPRGDLPAPYDE